MKFVVQKTETVTCGTGKPFCPGTLCLMLQMGATFWVEPPESPGKRQKLESCLPGLPNGQVVPKGTKTHHYVLTTVGPLVDVNSVPTV